MPKPIRSSASPSLPQAIASLKQTAAKALQVRKEPLWKGPDVDGITNSLLSKFLVDRERFRLYVVEGLKEPEAFSHKLEYGNMVHCCEEATAGNKPWSPALIAFAKGLVKRFPEQGKEIDKWYNVCKIQYPIYIKHWKANPDVKQRIPLFQEKVFDVPYKLPSGRTVILKGKFDSVDRIPKMRIGN